MVRFAASQSLGKRLGQEDSYGLLEGGEAGWQCFVVADGMGGHVGGSIASQIAVDAIRDLFGEGSMDRQEFLELCVTRANSAIARSLQDAESLKGMGTTLLVVLVERGSFYWVSVGDSPLFGLAADRKLYRLNQDHSMKPVLDSMVASGDLDEQSDEYKKSKNMLRSALTGGEVPLIDLEISGLELDSFAVVALASDGIDSLPHDELARIMNGGIALAHLPLSLIDEIDGRANPKQDNTTIVLLQGGDRGRRNG